MTQENAEFYVRSAPYLVRKANKIKRKARGKMAALRGVISGDFSSQKINISWEVVPNRFELINQLITQNNYQHYVEIGCSTDACFQNIAAPHKIGVDPFSGGTHRMTSDDFFAGNTQKFDIIFIDGLHTYAQVKNDMLNAVDALAEGGIILIHDCLPRNFYAQLPYPTGGDWNGDVWKAMVEMRTRPEIDSAVCLIDHGVGIIRKRNNQAPLAMNGADFFGLKYKDLVTNYPQWLRMISYAEALKF